MDIRRRIVAADYGFIASCEEEFAPPVNQNNFWIILEGEDGVGKTTLANALKHWLSFQNHRCVVEAFGKHFVAEPNLSEEILWMRFASEFSSRMPFLQDLISSGWSIIQDRSFISTIVYQNEWNRIMFFMDALFHQWENAPTHIFVLPPYGRYSILRDIKCFILPISGREIYLVFIPMKAQTLEERIAFVWNALKHGVRYVEGDTDDERTVDTNKSDTENGTGGDTDGKSVEVDGGFGMPFSNSTTIQLSRVAFTAPTYRNQSTNEAVDTTTTSDLGRCDK